MSESSRSDEQYRRETEARYWLQQTGGRKAEVDALIGRIEARRGKQAAQQLLSDMRKEWGNGGQDR